MKLTSDFIQHLSNVLKARLDWLSDVKWIGRQDPTSVITDGQDFLGMDDRNGNEAYIRYDGEDHAYAVPEKRLTSSVNDRVTANLRLVLVHRCSNEDAIEAALWNELRLAPFAQLSDPVKHSEPFEYRVKVLRSSKDKQRIYQEETGQESTTNTTVLLIAMNFELSYIRTAVEDPDCLPPCDGC